MVLEENPDLVLEKNEFKSEQAEFRREMAGFIERLIKFCGMEGFIVLDENREQNLNEIGDKLEVFRSRKKF